MITNGGCRTRSPGRTIARCVAAAGAAFAAVSISPWLSGAFVLLAAGSVAASAAQVHTLTRLQQIATDDIRGAISGMTAMTMSGFAGVAAAAMALAAAGAGPAPVVAVVAVLAVLAGMGIRADRGEPALVESHGQTSGSEKADHADVHGVRDPPHPPTPSAPGAPSAPTAPWGSGGSAPGTDMTSAPGPRFPRTGGPWDSWAILGSNQ